MAVSKRTRFEVLRRDNYTCRYCRSTEGPLTVDHVTPIALGGTDDPTNLVAACEDCNAGKASSSPDAAMVAQVEDDALRWSQAIARAAEITDARASAAAELSDWFLDLWHERTPHWADLPHDWRSTIAQFTTMGLTPTALEEAVAATVGRQGVPQRALFRYFCGVCWNKIRLLQTIAAQMLAVEDAQRG